MVTLVALVGMVTESAMSLHGWYKRFREGFG